jgi:hypothetical protein
MHGSFDRSGESDKGIYRSWRIGYFALPVLVVIALIGLAITHPNMSGLISAAVQAEFAGAHLAPETAPAQIGQPAMAIRTVKAN